jgi:hypothetical protein
MSFHPDQNLPGCMMPDGGECCVGHAAVVEDWHRQRKEIDGLRMLAKSLSDALLTIRPLGGSEMFRMYCGAYYADPSTCKAMIAQLHDDLHEARKAVVRARKNVPVSSQHKQERE